jgi:drug/metabolite transporter (DMT)-like permease
MDVTVGVFLALVTAITWGSREILLRKAFEATKPVTGLVVTMLATSVLSLIAAFFYESTFWNQLTATEVVMWAMIGGLHFPLAMTLYYQGIESVGGSRTSVVSNTSAIVTPLLGMALLSEPSTLNIIAGVFATGAGIITVSYSDADNAGWRWQRGIVYGLFAGIIWSVTNLLTRFGLIILSLPMTGLALAGGAPLIPVVIFLILKNRAKDLSGLRNRKLIVGSLLSGLGQVTLFAALAVAATVYVVPTYNLKSLVTVLFAYALIPKSEKVNARVILGALLAIGGIVLINI